MHQQQAYHAPSQPPKARSPQVSSEKFLRSPSKSMKQVAPKIPLNIEPHKPRILGYHLTTR